MTGPVALYDANVLYPFTLRDVLIRLGIAGVVRPRWTAQILDEVFRNLSRNRPELDPIRLTRTRLLMNEAVRDVTVQDYAHLMDGLELPDPDDRHVLAAAIKGEARVIVTKNLQDFPIEALEPWGLVALHPDDFLLTVQGSHPSALNRVVSDIAGSWRAPRADAEAVLDRLVLEVPRTVGLLRDECPNAR